MKWECRWIYPRGKRLRYTSAAATLLAVGLAVVALSGWILYIPPLMGLGQRVPTNPITAMALLAAAGAIALSNRSEGRIRAVRAGLSFVVLFVGTLSLLGYGQRLDLGLGTTLFGSQVDGRHLAPNVAICLVLLGSALMTTQVRRGGRHSPAPLLAGAMGLIALITVIGYAYGNPSFYGLSHYKPMSLNTSLALIALSVAIICAAPHLPLVTVILRGGPAERVTVGTFALSLTILALVTLISLHNALGVIHDKKDQDRIGLSLTAASDLLAALDDAEIGQRGFLLTGEDQYLEPYRSAIARVEPLLQELNLRLVSPEQRRHLRDLTPLVAVKLAELDGTILLRQEKGYAAARDVVLTGDGESCMKQIRVLLAQVRDDGAGRWAAMNAEEKRTGQQTFWTAACGGLITFALASIAAAFVRKAVVARRAADQQLRASEEQLRQMAEGIDDVFWMVDHDHHKVLYVSPQFERIWGRPCQELIANPNAWFQAIHPDDQPRVAADVAGRGLARGKEQEYRIVRPDGTVRWIHDRSFPIYDSAGRVYRVAGIASDITERRKLEQLREEAAAADAASQAKSAFLANMSHEIRSPIAAVMGHADMLLDPAQSADGRMECVQTIRQQSEHVLSVLNDILDLSKIEAGKLAVEHLPCNPAQIAKEVAALMQVRAILKGIDFKLVFDGPMPQTVQTDPTRLKQVLINLVGNAIKFTEAGQVKFVVKLQSLSAGASAVRFEVIDTGIGMTADQVAGLFQPFHQGDGSTTRRFGGTGLGLSISRQLTEFLGGRIDVESELDRGSRFTVTLPVGNLEGVPLVDTLAGPSSPPPPEPAPQPLRLVGRVLIADDLVLNVKVLRFYLETAGLEVTVAINGQDACEQAMEASNAGAPFDVVLMDMQMPVMDGYTATRKLRASGYTGPIVALTANAMSHDRKKCMDCGCDDYLAKPVTRQLLLKAIARHLDERTVPAPATMAAAGDPPAAMSDELPEELRPFLGAFMAELPGQVDRLHELLERQDLAGLKDMAHQIKGCAGLYRFTSISALAASLEDTARQESEIDRIAAQVQSLIELMRDIEGYDAGKEHATTASRDAA
jgi:PAS domain S-box-containing protein